MGRGAAAVLQSPASGSASWGILGHTLRSRRGAGPERKSLLWEVPEHLLLSKLLLPSPPWEGPPGTASHLPTCPCPCSHGRGQERAQGCGLRGWERGWVLVEGRMEQGLL